MSVNLVLGELRQLATLYGPGTLVPDGDGGYTSTPSRLTPAEWHCSIEKATVRSSERRFAATVIAQATHILTGRYHSGITTKTTLTWVDRAGALHNANVLDVDDTEGAGVETVLAVSEVVE